MFRTFINLLGLLTKRQRRDFYILQFLMLITSVTELIGTASIMPFMALAANPDIIWSNNSFRSVHIFLGEPPSDLFLAIVGLGFVLLLALSNVLLLFSQYLMNRYSFRLGGEISTKLYDYYLSKELTFHLQTNSATLIQRIMRDSHKLSAMLIAPALKLNARLFSIIMLVSLLFYINFNVALSSILALFTVYFLVFRFVRTKIYLNGQAKSQLDRTRNRLLHESFEGIKDIKLYATEDQYLNIFKNTTRDSNRTSSDNLILGESPYYFVETIVFTGIIFITLYFTALKGSLGDATPILTLYCMAGLKLVPKVQQSYLAITRIRGTQAVFKSLYTDLQKAQLYKHISKKNVPPLRPKKEIQLQNISYRYPNNKTNVLSNISLKLEAGTFTAIVGPSGSGKSTLLDIIIGLIEPIEGKIKIDGQELNSDNLSNWRRVVGYVPQTVYLSDTSIAENIAFGVDKSNINIEKVKLAAKFANINMFIEATPNKYWSSTGERGCQMSGGQRQRIGIARAFYRDISVLVLDEATSALDSETQANILNNLKKIDCTITIIMVTHREETIKFADNVIYITNGTNEYISR